ncbi:MAG: sigma-70 family RNA polymerase sigma factor [Polyangiaceae bacterium]|nr:sigma-70 family RNA polymerase sigma factor [Polyangiaceae bacterium]
MTESRDFQRFYQEHVAFAWRSLVRLGVPDADLPDLLQEAFLVAYRRLPEFAGRSKESTWLFGICFNVARNHRRHLARRESVGEGQDVADSPGSHDGRRAQSRRDKLSLVSRILGRLPEEQSLVFSLFEIEGFSGEEIAQLLDLPVGTVRSRLRLARAAFRAELGLSDPDTPATGVPAPMRNPAVVEGSDQALPTSALAKETNDV